MDKDYLILKRASTSRPSGEWNGPPAMTDIGALQDRERFTERLPAIVR